MMMRRAEEANKVETGHRALDGIEGEAPQIPRPQVVFERGEERSGVEGVHGLLRLCCSKPRTPGPGQSDGTGNGMGPPSHSSQTPSASSPKKCALARRKIRCKAALSPPRRCHSIVQATSS